jgi:hypothetical protein
MKRNIHHKATSAVTTGYAAGVVRHVLNSPGRPLDIATRKSLEPQFGFNFGNVRIHTGDLAAKSASAISARAYATGRDIVFGEGQYAPDTIRGKALLAHELTHVAQNSSDSDISQPLRLSSEADSAEQNALAIEKHVGEQQDAPQGRFGIQPRSNGLVRRSLLGGILGGLGGAVVGGTLGAVIGGPIGALVGAGVGLVAGALIGNSATTRERFLNADEVTYAKDIFKDTVNYSKIKITRDSMMSAGAPKTIGNTIHLRSTWGKPQFDGDTMNLTPAGMETLIHEMGHVWQYQNGGLAYIPASLWAQFKAAIGHGDRDAAYNWREADNAHVPWEKFNPEQQASAIEDYNILLRMSKEGTATISDMSDLSKLLPYMQKVWQKKGAPHF